MRFWKLTDVLRSAASPIERLFIKVLLKEYLEHMITLRIDPSTETAHFSVQLKGEEHPIDIDITGYRFDDAAKTLTIQKIAVSREWMQTAAEKFVAGKPIALPGNSATWIDLARKIGLI